MALRDVAMRRQQDGGSPPAFFATPKKRGWSKYGTLAGGSALSRSMKYAEPWLYGSVRGLVLPPDPYDVMRRSRLSTSRARSSSPRRRSGGGGGGSLSPPRFRVAAPDKRKSILECDVNAYELIARYLKTGHVPGDRGSYDSVGDDVLDDELSDDLSDNALENDNIQPVSKTPPSVLVIPKAVVTPSPKRAGGGMAISPVAPPPPPPPPPPTHSVPKAEPAACRLSGVTIGGQRIRLFSDARPSPGEPTTDPEADEDFGAEEECGRPQRPPRRAKRREDQRADESEAAAIKSILKKRAETFGDTIPKPASAAPPPDFYLSRLQRKKKQVQFRECGGNGATDVAQAQVVLRRSLSARVAVATLPAAVFNDTMRLRQRPRPDARLSFRPQRLVNPAKPRPTEPPPPPPPVRRLSDPTPETVVFCASGSAVGSTSEEPAPQPFPENPGRTIVRVSSTDLSRSPLAVHRLSVKSDSVAHLPSALPMAERKTSICIIGGREPTQEMRRCVSEVDLARNIPVRTSVMIRSPDTSFPPSPSKTDCNKVTINVGGVDTTRSFSGSASMFSQSSSRTVMDTAAHNTSIIVNKTNASSLTIVSPITIPNQIIIPVTPEPDLVPPKCEHLSSISVNTEESVITSWPKDQNNQDKDKQVHSNVVIVEDKTFENVSNVVIQTTDEVSIDNSTKVDNDKEDDVAIILLDPVEAVKRNLVPHVCGKKESVESGEGLGAHDNKEFLHLCGKDSEESDLSSSAVERLSSLLNQKIPTEDPIDFQEDPYFLETVISASLSSLDAETTARNLLLIDDISESDTITYASDTPTSETTSVGISSTRDKENHVELLEKLASASVEDTPAELRTSTKDDDEEEENIYESIKDHIYEEIADANKSASRSMFQGASKYDILNYLADAKERVIATGDCISETSLELSSRASQLSNASDSSEDSLPSKGRAEVERNDSGVGSETSHSSRSRWQGADTQLLCEDCDQRLDAASDSAVCRRCGRRRAERRELLQEIVDTEEKYARDLRIMLEEFYRPMLVAGLLSPSQLRDIFLNAHELLECSQALYERLRDTLDIAREQGDEDLLTVSMGPLFLGSASMLHAFEAYCTRQGAASLLLANLEKEKELLRIFLRVSQMENAVLRRMNLNSFLMVPVQRVTKYPLLLARLYKLTPSHHPDRELLKQAQHKIELHLEHINSEAKDISTMKLWRRISIINGRRTSAETDMLNMKLRKIALEVLEWNHDEVCFVMEGKLLYTNPTDNNWRKGRTIKLNPVNALLITKGKVGEEMQIEPPEESLLFPRNTGVQDATLLLLREKGGRYALLRDPLFLDKCVVCCETEWEDYFEVQELACKETHIFKGEDGDRTKVWFRQLQFHAQGLGTWRRRRNALANIINGMVPRN